VAKDDLTNQNRKHIHAEHENAIEFEGTDMEKIDVIT